LHLLSPDGQAAHFDATKLNWLGTMQQDVFIMVGWHAASAKNLQELKTKEYIDGAAAPNTDGSIIVPLMNTMLGTKLKLVTGYSGAAGELLAMERGEIDGAAMAYSSAIALRPDLLSSGKYEIMLQMGAAPHPDLNDIPFFNDLVKTDNERAILALIFSKYQMGRPFFVADGVPSDRLVVLRNAFDQTMKDPDLLADAKTQRLEINPLDGDAVHQLVAKLYGQPADVVHRARQILGREN
jgi:tripartite-type tricarboxylate transporter receptor subunit TctC